MCFVRHFTPGEAGAAYRYHKKSLGDVFYEFENFVKVSKNPTDQKQTEGNPRDRLLLARHLQ